MIALLPIGEDRFFIRKDGKHAGGITLHSMTDTGFSYGIAVAPDMRRQGVAKQALLLLFAQMKARGFQTTLVQVKKENVPSLRLHEALGFQSIQEEEDIITLAKTL